MSDKCKCDMLCNGWDYGCGVDAYHHMQAKSAYYMHAKLHFCVSIPQVFVFNWHTIYTHFHETGLHIQLNVHKETLFPP